MTFGNLYTLDNVAVIKEEIESFLRGHEIVITNVQFSVLYTSIYIPNAFMPLITGVVIDKYGLRAAMISLGIIAMIGDLIQGISSSLNIDSNGGFETFEFLVTIGRFINGMSFISL